MTDTDAEITSPTTTAAEGSTTGCECDCMMEAELAQVLEEMDYADLPPEMTGIAPAVLVVLAWYLWKRRRKAKQTPTPGG